MYVLIDTNIFISREADRTTPPNLTKLENILKKNSVNIIIHPLAVVEVSNYQNESRRRIALSKIEAYPQLQNPPDYTKDTDFSATFNGNSQSERVDNSLLYAVFKNSVDFLITEDKGLIIKANSLDLKQRVLLIDEALEFFQELFKDATITKPPALKEDYVYNLNLKDHIFDGLREDYSGFDDWFNRTAKAQRKCFVSYKQDGTIGAVEIYKDENESIHATPSFPQKKRLKICTLKVADNGYKLGELLLKLAVQYCIKKNIDEMYLTHFTKENDTLVNLISEYGFRKVAVKEDGEEIFVKNLKVPQGTDLNGKSPIDLCRYYYPSFYDGANVKKFIIPIKPEFHQILFTDYKGRQTLLTEYGGNFIVAGNTIKKIYLTHSKITKISPGDILVFYKSGDGMLTAVGVTESIYLGIKDIDQIIRIISNRTVYSKGDVATMLNRGAITAISFLWILYTNKPVTYADLLSNGVLKGAPQTIQEIGNDSYNKIKKMGGVDESYTIN